MPRKVFISILGAGKYEPCKYARSTYMSEKVRFVQQATIEYTQEVLGVEWTPNDKVLIFMTPNARKTHWVDSWKDGTFVEGLDNILRQMDFPTDTIEPVDIPNGNDESEMMEIFQTFYGKIEPGDELYFDITHGFRYLPMLVLVLVNYCKLLKNVKVRSITYVNYEGRNKEGKIAPIVALEELSKMQDCAIAMGSFIDNGNVGQLKRFCEEYDADADMLSLIQELSDTVDDWVNCRLEKFYSGRRYLDLRDRLKTYVNRGQTLPYTREMFGKIISQLSQFTPDDDIANPYIVAKWCVEHHYHPQALAIFKEAFVTEVCKRNALCHTNEADRNIVERSFTKISYDNRDEKKEFSYGDSDKNKVDELADKLEKGLLPPHYNRVDDARDEMMHARGKHSEDNVKEFIDNAYHGLTERESINKPSRAKRRKVLLSMTGASKYDEAKYTFNGGGIVSDVMATPSEGFAYCLVNSEERDNDDYAIYILTTPLAKSINWDGDDGMQARLAARYGHRARNVMLSDGTDAKAFYDNFNAIMSVIEPNDDVYIDISNALRFMQMMMLTIMEVARTVKKAEIKGVYYANHVKGKGITPIDDYTSLIALQDWIIVANDYKDCGQVKRLGKGVALFRKSHLYMLQQDTGAFSVVNAFSKAITTIVNDYWLGMRSEKIYSAKGIKACIENVHIFKSENNIPPLNPIVDIIIETFFDMNMSKKDVLHNGLTVAQWFFDKGLYLQCSILLHETLLSADSDVSSIIEGFRKTRNNFAHCGTLDNSMTPSELRDNLTKALKEAKTLLHNR